MKTENEILLFGTRIRYLDSFANILPQKHCRVQWPSKKITWISNRLGFDHYWHHYILGQDTKRLSRFFVSMIGVLPFLGAQRPNLEYLQVVADQKWVIGLLERLVYTDDQLTCYPCKDFFLTKINFFHFSHSSFIHSSIIFQEYVSGILEFLCLIFAKKYFNVHFQMLLSIIS